MVTGFVVMTTVVVTGDSAANAADQGEQVGFMNPASGRWILGGREDFFFGVKNDIPFLGDWDGNGTDTPGLYRSTSGFAYVRNTRDTGVADESWFMGNPGDIPIVGDWDGDGKDSFGVYRPSEGKVYLRNATTTGPAEIEYFFGKKGDKPFAGDFNGDGKDTVGLHRESTGLVYMTNQTGSVPAVANTDLSFFWGDPNDIMLSGDWTGDGTDTPGLVRPSASTLFLRFENTLGFADLTRIVDHADWRPVAGRIPGAPATFELELSGAAEAPAPGDSDGSGLATIGITGSGEVCYELQVGGVSGLTQAHIHTGAAGLAGPIEVDLNLPGNGLAGCVSTTEQLAREILDEPQTYYLNLHNAEFPGGALRGQLAERRQWDLGLVGARVVPAGNGDADAFVEIELEVVTNGRVCITSYEAQRLGNVSSVLLRNAVEGARGPRVVNLTFGGDGTGCVGANPIFVTTMIIAAPFDYYLEIRTTQYPKGAVRAQLFSGD